MRRKSECNRLCFSKSDNEGTNFQTSSGLWTPPTARSPISCVQQYNARGSVSSTTTPAVIGKPAVNSVPTFRRLRGGYPNSAVLFLDEVYNNSFLWQLSFFREGRNRGRNGERKAAVCTERESRHKTVSVRCSSPLRRVIGALARGYPWLGENRRLSHLRENRRPARRPARPFYAGCQPCSMTHHRAVAAAAAVPLTPKVPIPMLHRYAFVAYVHTTPTGGERMPQPGGPLPLPGLRRR